MKLSALKFTWKFTCYLFRYMKVLWVFFIISALGTLALASLLLSFESRIDNEFSLAVGSSGVGPIASSLEKREGAAKPSQRAAVPATGNTNANEQLRQIREELHEISGVLSDMNRESSSQFHSEVSRLDALDSKLRALTTYWSRLEESRRMSFGYAMYATLIAMLGQGDFGARSDGGRVIVVLAGCWGVFTFWLVTVVMMWAVNRAYDELLKDAAGRR